MVVGDSRVNIRRRRSPSARQIGRTWTTVPSPSRYGIRSPQPLWSISAAISNLRRDHQARGRGMGVEAAVVVGDARFGGRDAATEVYHETFRAQTAGARRDRAHVVRLQFEG